MSFGKEVADIVMDVVEKTSFRGPLKSVELSWKESDGTQFNYTWVSSEGGTYELVQRIQQDLSSKDIPDMLMAMLSLNSELPDGSRHCFCAIPLTIEDFEDEDEEDEEVEVVVKEFKPEHSCNCKGCKTSCNKQEDSKEEVPFELCRRELCAKLSDLIDDLKDFTLSLAEFKQGFCK